MSDEERKQFDRDGVSYRTVIGPRPYGYRAIWVCDTCRVAETWPCHDAAQGNELVQAGIAKHHAEKHSGTIGLHAADDTRP